MPDSIRTIQLPDEIANPLAILATAAIAIPVLALATWFLLGKHLEFIYRVSQKKAGKGLENTVFYAVFFLCIKHNLKKLEHSKICTKEKCYSALKILKIDFSKRHPIKKGFV